MSTNSGANITQLIIFNSTNDNSNLEVVCAAEMVGALAQFKTTSLNCEWRHYLRE